MSNESQGYKKLIVWELAKEIRRKVYQITKRFSKSEMRRTSQMNDAARSVKQNIQEGHKSGSTAKFVNSLNISQGSLAELIGDIEDCLEDGLITKDEFKDLDSLTGREDYLLMRLIQALRGKDRKGRK